ncbi:MAG TPA: YlbF family regulator [Planctomycetota bacterium]|nr:YlbF family regulator [Planctomycetota bacterium]
MDDAILAQADKLAELLAADPRFERLRAAEDAVLKTPELKRLMEEFEQARLSVARKEREFTPVEPSEKRALADLQRRVQDSAPLRDLAKAQADYAQMMDRVNRAIHARLQAGLSG